MPQIISAVDCRKYFKNILTPSSPSIVKSYFIICTSIGNSKYYNNFDFKWYNYLSGFLPLPDNFTTVGKPQIVVNQYDSPLDVYSEDTLDEMKEERLTMQNPEVMERINQKAPVSDNPLAAQQARQFDPARSNVLGALVDNDPSRGQWICI